MSELRPATIQSIRAKLDQSHFTVSSFEIDNQANQSPFLTIKFIPDDRFTFQVRETSDYQSEIQYETIESPGNHMASGENYEYKSFARIIVAVAAWARRIEQDFRTRRPQDSELEEFLNALKQKVAQSPNDNRYFTKDEADELKEKLSSLESVIQKQAESLEKSEKEIAEFKQQLNEIKTDIDQFPKGVWYQVAGSKIIKAVSGFVSSAEGRKLISDSIKNLLEWK